MNSLIKEINDPSTGKLIVFGARPGMGMNKICLQLANELGKEELVLLIKDQDYTKDNEAQSYQLEKNLTIDTGIAKDVESFFFQLEKVMEQDKYSWIIVDDLSRIFYLLIEYHMQERNRVIVKLKRLIHKYRCSLIIGTVLSNDVDYRGGDRCPELLDFNWSQNLTSLADALYGIYIPGVYGIKEDEYGVPIGDLVEIICRKHLNKLPHTFQLYGNPFDRLSESNSLK